MSRFQERFSISSMKRTSLLSLTGTVVLLLGTISAAALFASKPKQPMVWDGFQRGTSIRTPQVKADPPIQQAPELVKAADPSCVMPDEYWREKPQEWSLDNLMIGKFTYSQEQLMELLQSDSEDLKARLQRQFVATALNWANGADLGVLQGRMDEAARWLDGNLKKPTLNEQDVLSGEVLAGLLAAFNRGEMGSSLCEGIAVAAVPDQPSPTPTSTSAPAVVNSRKTRIAATPTPTARPESRRQGDNREANEAATAPIPQVIQPSPQPPIALPQDPSGEGGVTTPETGEIAPPATPIVPPARPDDGNNEQPKEDNQKDKGEDKGKDKDKDKGKDKGKDDKGKGNDDLDSIQILQVTDDGIVDGGSGSGSGEGNGGGNWNGNGGGNGGGNGNGDGNGKGGGKDKKGDFEPLSGLLFLIGLLLP